MVLRRRDPSGTTTEERYYHLLHSAVLPLWPTVLPLGPDKAHKKGNEFSIEAERFSGCDKDVYVLIPP